MKNRLRSISYSVIVLAATPIFAETFSEEKHFETIAANEAPYYLIINKDPQGYNVELSDGSIWRMPDKSSADIVSYWHRNDSIVIHPVLFPKLSGSRFYFYNERTRDSAYAELSQGPLLNTPTHNLITFIDHRTRELQICDGLNRCNYWLVDRSDYSKLNNWEAGQTVILGSNENCYAGWFSRTSYILINVERNEYIHARLSN